MADVKQRSKRKETMTREELKKIVEGVTDEQLDKILGINGADIKKPLRGCFLQKKERQAQKTCRNVVRVVL